MKNHNLVAGIFKGTALFLLKRVGFTHFSMEKRGLITRFSKEYCDLPCSTVIFDT